MRLNEKLGVPDGIIKQAEKLYSELMVDLEKMKSNGEEIPTLDEDSEEFVILIGKYDLKIKDLDLRDVPFILNIGYYQGIEKPILVSASYGSEPKYSYKDGKITSRNSRKSTLLSATIAVSDDQSKESIVDTVKSDLKANIIAHELMHIYDSHKNRSKSIEDMADYVSYKSGRSFPKLISEFFYLLYYTTSIENTVRPSEMYHQMLISGVTKSDFKEFISENDIMKTLTKAEEFSLDKFKEELNNNSDVDLFINLVAKDGYKRIGDNAEDSMNLIMINLLNSKFDTLHTIMNKYIDDSVGHFPIFMGLITGDDDKVRLESERAEAVFAKIASKSKKYENDTESYFKSIEKNFNIVGNRVKRKLYKLYDLLENKKDDIIDWDLHMKINAKKNKNESFILDFKKFNFSRNK